MDEHRAWVGENRAWVDENRAWVDDKRAWVDDNRGMGGQQRHGWTSTGHGWTTTETWVDDNRDTGGRQQGHGRTSTGHKWTSTGLPPAQQRRHCRRPPPLATSTPTRHLCRACPPACFAYVAASRPLPTVLSIVSLFSVAPGGQLESHELRMAEARRRCRPDTILLCFRDYYLVWSPVGYC